MRNEKTKQLPIVMKLIVRETIVNYYKDAIGKEDLRGVALGIYAWLYFDARLAGNHGIPGNPKSIAKKMGHQYGEHTVRNVLADLENMELVKQHQMKKDGGHNGKKYYRVQYVWSGESVDKFNAGAEFANVLQNKAKKEYLQSLYQGTYMMSLDEDSITFKFQMHDHDAAMEYDIKYFFDNEGKLIARGEVVQAIGDRENYEYTVPTERLSDVLDSIIKKSPEGKAFLSTLAYIYPGGQK